MGERISRKDQTTKFNPKITEQLPIGSSSDGTDTTAPNFQDAPLAEVGDDVVVHELPVKTQGELSGAVKKHEDSKGYRHSLKDRIEREDSEFEKERMAQFTGQIPIIVRKIPGHDKESEL